MKNELCFLIVAMILVFSAEVRSLQFSKLTFSGRNLGRYGFNNYDHRDLSSFTKRVDGRISSSSSSSSSSNGFHGGINPRRYAHWGTTTSLLSMTPTSSAPRMRRQRMTSTNTNTSSNAQRYITISDIQALLKDVVSVALNTGLEASVVRTFKASKAIASITQDFMREPATFYDDKGKLSPPKFLKALFEKLGATYIKLGQFIASSPTLFPPEYVREFQSCLDQTPKVSYSIIRRIIQEELKGPISATFLSVDPVPLASASIAQVHRAKLRDGTDVVIKVRKPDVSETLTADLGFLYSASRILEFVNPSLGRLSLTGIVGDIRESMLKELDFELEANNLVKFREFLDRKGIVGATAPMPYPAASGKRILTMEYLRGAPLVDLEGIRQYSDNSEATLINALSTWAASVAENDFFHADVHGGNLLVLEDGRIGFIDFGIVGKISERVWGGINDLVIAFVNDDFRGVADALVRIGATDTSINVDKFGEELREVVMKITNLEGTVVVQANGDGDIVGAQLNVDERETTEVVLQIVSVAEKNGLRLPREFGLLLKQSLYFDRYLKLLAPGLDPLRDARVKEAYNTQKKPIIIDAEVIDR